jgi:ATP-dependent 26S proteasome regulatory subunit
MQKVRIHNIEVPISVLLEYRSIQTQITESHFSFDLFVKLMQVNGKILMDDPSFRFIDVDRKVLLCLYAYLTHDQKLCEFYNIDPNKGLFLTGPTGVGKTLHSKLLRLFYNYNNRYRIKPCHQIALEYMDEGAPILNKYGRNYIDRYDHSHDKQVYCFDDLGTEDEVKHYGTQTNVMGQIIMMRYDLFQVK